MVRVKEDLTGRTFGKLTVIKQVDDYISPKGDKKAQWLCECSCDEHNQVVVAGMDLKSQNTQSCGCLRVGNCTEMGQNNKKYNNIMLNLVDEHGIYGVGYCSNTNTEFYFDLEDYDKIKNYTWSEIIDKGYHRLLAFIPELDKHQTMAQIIVGDNYDHADRNPLNNRRYNLREATTTQNAQNHSLRKDNTSGITGVILDIRYNIWTARITVNKERIYLGCFNNKQEAIKARLRAEKEYFGEFAPQKHLFEKYNIT